MTETPINTVCDWQIVLKGKPKWIYIAPL